MNYAQSGKQVEQLDSQYVKISIPEFRYIIKTFSLIKYQDSIITVQEKRYITQQNIIADKDSVIKLQKENEEILKTQIKETENPFYNTFWFGFTTAAAAIISLVIIL